MSQVPAPTTSDALLLTSLFCDESIEDIVPTTPKEVNAFAASSLLDLANSSRVGRGLKKRVCPLSMRSEKDQLKIWIDLLLKDHAAWKRPDKTYEINIASRCYRIQIDSKGATVLQDEEMQPCRRHT